MDKRSVDTLLIRMDKLGDLVLSLAVDEHPVLGGQRVHWFITKGLAFVADQSVPKRLFTEFSRGFSVFEFLRMVRWLRENRPRTVVLLHNPWWVSLAVWWAGVPERIGRLSQWHSFLFFNVPIRQKRSLADRHESDFNFDLVEWGFVRLGCRTTYRLDQVKRTFLRLVPPNPFGTVGAHGLNVRAYRIVHPGMAGSALNWPVEYYGAIVKELAKEMPVLITGTKMDQKYLAGLESIKDTANVRWMVDQLKPFELLDLLSQARSVIAPSTGIVHLAASLGSPTLGIYSPRRVEHPKRWGPKGLFAHHLVPPVQEADNFAPDIMKQITPELVLETVHKIEQPRHESDLKPTV